MKQSFFYGKSLDTKITYKFIFLFLLMTLLSFSSAYGQYLEKYKKTIFLEAEGFSDKGGWVVDQQYMDEMGSPVLLAHGIGIPVADASTKVVFPVKGKYRLYVRTRNWVAPWTTQYAPGRFQVVVDRKTLKTEFGTEGNPWHWQEGDSIEIDRDRQEVTIAVHDLTGFDGRFDAICFTADDGFIPPNTDEILTPLRYQAQNLPKEIPDAQEKPFDLIVVGGGLGGICAAITAARLGLETALIQDRPVLGGNASSEIRVGLAGMINQAPYRNLGNLVYQLRPQPKNSQIRPLSLEKNVEQLVLQEKRLHLYLNTHVNKVDRQVGDKEIQIQAVYGQHLETGRILRFKGKLFADCTGDGNLGYLSGADWRMGREARSETGEPTAPEVADKMTMGASFMWGTREMKTEINFPELPWAVIFTPESIDPVINGSWDWETGLFWDQVHDAEKVRDHGLRAVYGHWSYMKNKIGDPWKDIVRNRTLSWVPWVAGKRESRRLLGDVILKEQDIRDQKEWDDASVTTTWPIDLHYPQKNNTTWFKGEEFRTFAPSISIKPYSIPYRCFYSRNVSNLFMAGRDISVTHVALGTTRVMRTGGMMGEVVGMAASICRQNDCMPRLVYQKYLPELKKLMEKGIAPPSPALILLQKQSWMDEPGENLALKAKVSVPSTMENYDSKYINDGKYNLDSNKERWVSARQEATKRTRVWAALTFEKPTEINAMIVASGQAGPQSPLEDFVLQYEKDGKFIDIPDTLFIDNQAFVFGIKFPTVKAKTFRLLSLYSHDIVRLWDWQLYRLPDNKE